MPQDRWLDAIKRLLNAESYFRAREGRITGNPRPPIG